MAHWLCKVNVSIAIIIGVGPILTTMGWSQILTAMRTFTLNVDRCFQAIHLTRHLDRGLTLHGDGGSLLLVKFGRYHYGRLFLLSR